MALSKEAQDLVKNISDNIVKEVTKFLSNNKEFLAGMGVGAALSTPAGKALVARLGKDAKQLITLANQYGRKAVKDAVKYTLDSKVSKVNLFESSRSGKLGKAVDVAAKISAAKIAGEIAGAWIGNVLSSKNVGEAAWKVTPIAGTIDAVKENVAYVEEQNAKKKAGQQATAEVVKAIQQAAENELISEERQKTGQQVVEYEKNKAKKSYTSTTTSDQLNKFLAERGRANMKGNHPTWYGKNAELNTANLNYGVIKQAEADYEVGFGAAINMNLVTPMRSGFVSQAYKDSISAIYVKMRGSNSGAFNYDEEDVAAYIECVRGIRALLKTLQRDLKLCNEAKVYESNTPNIYLAVAGYNATGQADLKANRVVYASELNLIADTLETRFPLPPVMSVIERTDYISETILLESTSVKRCFYIYTLHNVLTPDTNQVLKYASTVDATSFGNRIAVLRKLIDDMYVYQNLSYADTTFTKIAGDIVKAYGEKAFSKYDRVTIGDRATMLYDEYLLHQLQNACGPQYAVNALTFNSTTNIYDATITVTVTVPGNSLYTIPLTKTPGLIGSSGLAEMEMLVNSNKDKISQLETLSLTRNVNVYRVNATTITYNTPTTAVLHECGTDQIESIIVYFYGQGNVTYSQGMIHRGKSVMPFNEVQMWTQIDYFPLIMSFDDSNNNGNSDKLFDIDNYALMSRRQLITFNDICTKSLYKTVNITEQANFKSARHR